MAKSDTLVGFVLVCSSGSLLCQVHGDRGSARQIIANLKSCQTVVVKVLRKGGADGCSLHRLRVEEGAL